MRLYTQKIILLALCALGMTTVLPRASAAERGSRMVVVVAGNMSVRDIADPKLRHFAALFRSGSAALMNVRASRPSKLVDPALDPGMEAGCVSLGAGTMATAGMEATRAGNANGLINGVRVRDTYECRTGLGPDSAEVLHIEIVRMTRANELSAYHAKPGHLGSALRLAGIRTAIIGNSDMPGAIHREAVAAAMDGYGVVDRGDVDSQDICVQDGRAPYGVRTSTRALVRELDRVLPQCRFVVVDFGDTLRADKYAAFCTDDQAISIRRAAAKSLDAFVAEVGARLNFRKDCLVVLSPSSRTFTAEMEEERLAPILVRGPGFREGVLTSPSTRRAGVVTLGDVAPTILSFFGVKPPAGMAGRPAVGTPKRDTARMLVDLNLSASEQAQRQPVMRGASVAQSVVVVLVTAAAFLLASGRLKRLAAWLALLPAAVMLAMLYFPLLYSGGLIVSAALLVVFTLCLLALFAVAFRKPYRAFAWMCAVTVVSLLVDLAFGGSLTSSSIAGYSLTEGARYYGIGNELMGTLLGAAIIGLGAALATGRVAAKLVPPIAAVVLAAVFVAIGGSRFGANAGGAAAAIPAIAVMVLLLRGWRPSVRGVVLVLLFAVLAMAGLFAFDAMRGGGQSHIGRVVGQAANEGGPGILEMAERKIALNFMLLSTSVWSRLLGLGLLGSALAYWRLRQDAGEYALSPEERAAAISCCVATAGAFAFNDSGVLAAATCCVFLWMLLVLKMLTGTDAAASPRQTNQSTSCSPKSTSG